MNQAKIRLSSTEMELVKNADWILTKNRIIQKVKDLFGGLRFLQEETLYESLEGVVPEEVLASACKITAGEQYRGLPWVVLDHPRYFSKTDIMAIRTLFWWGRSFSVTLHLSGSFKKRFEQKIITQYHKLTATGNPAAGELTASEYYICINHTEWEHHFEADNYKAVTACSHEEWETIISGRSFIKMSKRIPLDAWDGPYNIAEVLAWHYFSLVKLLE